MKLRNQRWIEQWEDRPRNERYTHITHIEYLQTNNLLRNQSYGIITSMMPMTGAPPSTKPTTTATNTCDQPGDEETSLGQSPNVKQSIHKEIF